MAYHRTGRPAEARQELQQVRNAVQKSGFDPGREGDLPFAWYDWLRLHILLREAEGLILYDTRSSRPTRSRGEPATAPAAPSAAPGARPGSPG
jgi:hypothetical protein